MTFDGYANNITNTAEIAFLCDETKNGISDTGPVSVVGPANQKKLMIEWWTAAACPPVPVSCSFLESSNHFYDLSDLRKTDGTSYEAYDLSYMKENGGDENNKNRIVLVNMCDEIFPSADVTCPYGSAVCEPSTGISYGSALTLEIKRETNKTMNLDAIYTDGSDCDCAGTCKDDLKKWRSIFHLYCNTNDPDRSPRLLFTNAKNCTAEFEWSSEHPCRVESTTSESCKIKDPNTNHVFDFSMLATKSGIEFVNPDTHDTYIVGVCGPAKQCCDKPPCDAVACKKDKSEKNLYENKMFSFKKNGILRLEYKADKSGEINYFIDFVCDKSAGHLEHGTKSFKNVSYDSDEKLWYFEYHTALACMPMAGLCTTFDRVSGMHFDLTELAGITMDAQEEITWNGNQFALTVCGNPPDHTVKPLVDYPKCQAADIAGAQGYFIEDTYKKNSSDCFSLGNIQSQPHLSKDRRDKSFLTIDMFGGSPCAKNPNIPYSALVRIECAPVEHELEYDGDVNCEQWMSLRHPAACAVHQSSSEFSDCTFVDPIYNRTYDMKELKVDGGYTIGDGKYKFQVCDILPECKGGVCWKQAELLNCVSTKIKIS